MSFGREAGRSPGGADREGRPSPMHVALRPAVAPGRLGTGTLACERCDAPVSLGGRTAVLTDALCCPFCGHRAPARDFLSLAAPTRPARVAIHVRRPRAAQS